MMMFRRRDSITRTSSSSSPILVSSLSVVVILLSLLVERASSFVVMAPVTISKTATSRTSKSSLSVSIGLGPEEQKDQAEEDKELVPGVDYEVPDHEEYRTARRSKLDEACDDWFDAMLNNDNNDDSPQKPILGSLAEAALAKLMTPVELKNEFEVEDHTDPEWTPYVSTKLPWMPLTPSYGLEQFGLPIPRRNAETWKHFDVPGMIAQDYSGTAAGTADSTGIDVEGYQKRLQDKGAWLNDDECSARLVYINGRFVPELSKTTDTAHNLDDAGELSEEMTGYLGRLTDGYTDELVVPVSNGEIDQTSYAKLSGPNHAIGDPTSQFAVNSQQGTACFAALNTIKANSIAYVHAPESCNGGDQGENAPLPQPVLIVNAVTPSGGAQSDDNEKGVACHPRTFVVAEKDARLSVVQSSVDLLDDDGSQHRPKLYNGYTQFFVKEGANVTHSYLEETGGVVTPGVELGDDDLPADAPQPREIESQRPELKDTHLEAIDVHVMGEKGFYTGTVMSIGGNGRARVGMSVALLQPEARANVNGFCLSGGVQRTDIKTNIHHIAQGTTSRQMQKNMIGGRSTGAFRGRIRVEQSAQQTDSQQLSRSVLLSDKARAWAVPSLEIIADDVQCTHGSTVSDLSEEELFYLRSRGLGRSMARNLLMYAFAGDVCTCVDPAMLGAVDSDAGLQKRVIRRLENLVPQGERAVKGEFQSV